MRIKQLQKVACAGIAGLLLCATTQGASFQVEAQEQSGNALNEPVFTTSFESEMGLIIVPVRLGESRVLRCILDTGMVGGLFLLDPALGEELNLEYMARIPIGGAGSDPMTADFTSGATLHFGDLTFRDQTVLVISETTDLAGMGIDGVIGATLFYSYVVELDFETPTLTLYRNKGFDASASGDSIPLEITATKPYIEAKVSIEDGEPVPVTMVVDTGARTAMDIGAEPAHGLVLPDETLEAVVLSGVGGDVHGFVGRTSTLDIGTHRLTEVVTSFSDLVVGGSQGTIGIALLRHFHVTFDYSKKRMFLRPASSFAEPFEYNMAGVRLYPRTDGSMTVASVCEGSTGAASGIRKGDVIQAIDGHSVSEISDTAARQMFLQHGTTLTLSITRDGEDLEFEVPLKRMI